MGLLDQYFASLAGQQGQQGGSAVSSSAVQSQPQGMDMIGALQQQGSNDANIMGMLMQAFGGQGAPMRRKGMSGQYMAPGDTGSGSAGLKAWYDNNPDATPGQSYAQFAEAQRKRLATEALGGQAKMEQAGADMFTAQNERKEAQLGARAAGADQGPGVLARPDEPPSTRNMPAGWQPGMPTAAPLSPEQQTVKTAIDEMSGMQDAIGERQVLTDMALAGGNKTPTYDPVTVNPFEAPGAPVPAPTWDPQKGGITPKELDAGVPFQLPPAPTAAPDVPLALAGTLARGTSNAITAPLQFAALGGGQNSAMDKFATGSKEGLYNAFMKFPKFAHRQLIPFFE